MNGQHYIFLKVCPEMTRFGDEMDIYSSAGLDLRSSGVTATAAYSTLLVHFIAAYARCVHREAAALSLPNATPVVSVELLPCPLARVAR
jgi:hypothetical protein